MFFSNEEDGMRVVTLEKTYFLEKVQPETANLFTIGTIDPGAKLLYAKRCLDYNSPHADEILRSLDKQLVDGIVTLLEAAMQTHFDVKLLKHLLVTASMAKKFTDVKNFNPD